MDYTRAVEQSLYDLKKELVDKNKLLKEMAEALEEIVNDARGYLNRSGHEVTWLQRGESALSRYKEQTK